MSNTHQPAQFDWATELSDAQGRVTLSEQEAKEIGARLRSMGAKLKSYEDLGDAANDMQLLRAGYDAARLEIESLQARIKTMAEEHADELTVAHLDGRMRAAQPAPAQADPTQVAPAAVAGPVVNRATVIEWLDANDIEVTDRQMDGLFHSATPTTPPAQVADSVLEDAARGSEYQRGYRHGYEQRDAEVRGALA